jgi:hypothetical protein
VTAPAAEAAEGVAAKATAKRAAATEAAPARARAVKAPNPRGGSYRAGQIKKGTAYVAGKTSTSDRGGKPSTLGHAAKGSAAGAGIGAVAGSVVPGVGTAIGAGVGAAVGGVAGGVSGSRAKGDYRRKGRSRGRQILVTEFVVAVVILALSPLTDKHKSDTPGQWMKRATGICALFVVLGLVGSIGERTARACSAFGGLVLLVLLLSDRDILTVIAARFAAPTPTGPAGPGSGGENAGPLESGGEGDISQGTGGGPGLTVSQPQQTAPRPRG